MEVFALLLLIVSSVSGKHSSLPPHFVKANNDFTIHLHSHVINQTRGNVVYTSFSVQSMLALISLGAKGETEEEIKNVINFSSVSNEKIKNDFKTVFELLEKMKQPKLHTLNHILVKNGTEIKPEFKEVAEKYFYTKFGKFNSKVDAAKKINTLIGNMTTSTSSLLVEEQHIDDTKPFMVVSTQFVRGTWKHIFRKNDTYKADFHNSKTDVSKVDMMKLSAHLLINNDPKYHLRMLVLPYQHEQTEIIIYLPDDIDGLSVIEENAIDVWDRRNFSRKYVEVHLPKFKIDSIINIKECLKNMGITKLISGADLSAISNEKLEASVVVQIAHIEVDEDGTRAPSKESLSVIEEEKSSAEVVEVFKVNHPFIFAIMYEDLGFIVGKVNRL